MQLKWQSDACLKSLAAPKILSVLSQKNPLVCYLCQRKILPPKNHFIHPPECWITLTLPLCRSL